MVKGTSKNNIFLGAVQLSALLVLTACGHFDSVKNRGQVHDSGPAQPVNVSHILDAVPKFEVRTSAGNTSPYHVLGSTYHVLKDSRGFRQRGVASWYGRKFHGRPTANGERYDMYAMSAAHKSLPIPSYVRVANVENGRSVVVRINDRGPFHQGRVIDLSYVAAAKLGFADQGTANVDIIALEPASGSSPSALHRFLQAGAFGSQALALALKSRIAAWTRYPVVVSRNTPADNLFRVRIGPIADNRDLAQLRQLLQQKQQLEPHIVYETTSNN